MHVQVHVEAFSLPKHGNTAEEYEDAFSHSLKGRETSNCTSFRCAIADGATETSFSGMWAKQLVRSFTKPGKPGDLLAEIPELQRRWAKTVGRRPLPWYAEEKASAGAFAAFLGLHLEVDPSEPTMGSWKAVGLGDCCLVHLRAEAVLKRFPLQESSEFSNRPRLVSSNPRYNDTLAVSLQSREGRWQAEDDFYLMSDAMALWFYRKCEEGSAPWETLRDFGTREECCAFSEFVDRERKGGSFRNDDVTFLRVNVWASAG